MMTSRAAPMVLFGVSLVLFPVFLVAEVLSVRVSADPGVQVPESGRLFVAFSATDEREPRFSPGDQVANADPFFALDVSEWDGSSLSMEESFVGYPLDSLAEIPDGEWYVQALYDTNRILSDINSPGNYFSDVIRVGDSATETRLNLVLSQQEPPDTLPDDTDRLKFVRIRSELLSEFYGADIFVRAAVMLPASYDDTDVSFPVAYHIGGLNARYTRAAGLLDDEEFSTFWNDPDSPQIILVFLDGESPFGDSYQVNSANSGPYGDANMRELFPALQERFRIVDSSAGRFATGCSTGGWAALAMQVFDPDYFNGVWSFSPDSPSFEAFQLVNLKEDENAFVNASGYERPSRREINGEPTFSIRQEMALEGALGADGSFAYSGQQWGTWNAVYGPRADDGRPALMWDQLTGRIDKQVVEAWEPYDLNERLKSDWPNIGASLAGKIHIRMGDMDNYYLTEGTRILEQTLAELSAPDPDAEFSYVPYHGHCRFGTRVEYIDVIEAMVRKYQAAPPGATRITP